VRSKNSQCGIYCIKNTENNKRYVGFSVDIHRRFVTHKKLLKDNKHTNSHLQNAYNKYGKDCFEYFIVQELPEDNEILCDFEVYWIVYFDSFIENNGYNLTMGGEGICLKKHSDETKAKLSRAFKGRVSPAKGKTMSQDQKDKISNSNKGKRPSNEHRMSMSISKKSDKSSSLHPGVSSYGKNKSHWRAKVCCDGTTLSRNGLKTEEEAIFAYFEMLNILEKRKLVNNG
jgi:group I intron endonuclease